MARRWVVLAALCVAASGIGGCGSGYFDSEETRGPVTLDWGEQGDRESLESLLAQCEAGVGLRFSKGARVKFLADPTEDCATSFAKVAGCWRMDLDLILLATAPRLAETALCHELLHRELFRIDGDADVRHHRDEWHQLSQAIQQEKALPEGS